MAAWLSLPLRIGFVEYGYCPEKFVNLAGLGYEVGSLIDAPQVEAAGLRRYKDNIGHSEGSA